MIAALLERLDRGFYDRLLAHPDQLPVRMRKLVAWHDPDAGLRKP